MILYNANVDADAYTPLIVGQGENKTISGSYRANHGSGTEDLEATLILQVCHANDPKHVAYNEIGWVDESTHSFPSAIAGVELSPVEFNFANAIGKAYRIKIDMTGGTDGQVQIDLTDV